MKVFTGKQLFDAFTSIDTSMKGLERLVDGKFHLSAQMGSKEFNLSGERKEVLEKFNEWLKFQCQEGAS